MNAAARLANERVLSRRLSLSLKMTKAQFALMLMTFLVLMSAVGLIYTTHLSRILNAYFQQQIIEQSHLQVMRGQLLLERSTRMVQAKTEIYAESQLHMFVPDFKSITVIKAS